MSVFGLAFILTFCGVITLLEVVIFRFMVQLWGSKRALAPRIDSWIQDGVFQLQRRAYEAHGEGPWERRSHEVPVTVGHVRLSTLPVDCPSQDELKPTIDEVESSIDDSPGSNLVGATSEAKPDSTSGTKQSQ